MITKADRELDVVLLGATGFVGRLTAEHLARFSPAGVTIGLAASSAERLQQLRDELPPPARDWPLLVTDVREPEVVGHLARRTRVLASTVGPYLRNGLRVVEACAMSGTHYVDLTGETVFVRRSIDSAHQRAQQTGARIVHSCGFDSIPSDLGVGLAAARAARDGAGRLTEAVLHVRAARAGISGGTIDSLRQQLLEVKSDRSLRRLVGSQYALTSDPSGDRRPRRPTRAVAQDKRTGRWTAPFVMGAFNGQIVQRSNELSGWSYGRELDYREVIDTGRGSLGRVQAAGLSAGTQALMAAMWFGPTQRLLDRVLPDPGEGPSEQTRRNGRFVIDVEATTHHGGAYRTRVAAEHDPGYDGTAIMLGESALCLAADTNLADRAGVLTPMTAMGAELAMRLRARGFTLGTARC